MIRRLYVPCQLMVCVTFAFVASADAQEGQVESRPPGNAQSDRSVEAASIIESYLLGMVLPERFDVAIKVSEMTDFGETGVGEEVIRMRWRHDRSTNQDLFAREKITSVAIKKMPEVKRRKLSVHALIDGKYSFRDLPHDVHTLGRGAPDDFRESADAPAFELLGVIPFTETAIPSVYVEKLRKHASTPAANTKMNSRDNSIYIRTKTPANSGSYEDGHWVRKWKFDAVDYLPVSTSSQKFDSAGEHSLDSVSFSEECNWGKIGDIRVPLSVRGERTETQKFKVDQDADPSEVHGTVYYECEFKWINTRGKREADEGSFFDRSVLTNVKSTLDYLDCSSVTCDAKPF